MYQEIEKNCMQGGVYWPEFFDQIMNCDVQPTEKPVNIDVIIPALNEEDSIGKVLADIPRDLVRRIIVVDNGSTDRTPAIAALNAVDVVYEPEKGYGNACLAGIDALSDAPPDIVVFLDADYSDYPGQMVRLIAPIVCHGIDMVIGSRTLGRAKANALLTHARLGNLLACSLVGAFWGYRFTDLGPFRAIRYDALKRLKMRDRDFGWTIEMQIKSAVHRLSCVEVPVDYRPRIGHSKISGTLLGSAKASRKILQLIAGQAVRKAASSLISSLNVR